MALIKEQAKEQINKLIDKYQKVLETGNLKTYNEARTKTEFIESLFEYLNWDVRNKDIPDEVLPEDKVSRGRADYAFRIGSVTRFFVEAKSLKKGIENIDDARQTIGYGWHKGVTFSVLTDFDSLKVFNCEWNEPNIMRNFVFELKYTQYISEFDKLWLLSKESILNGALGDYAKSIGKRAIRKNLFNLLLDEFTEWRERLSKDIVKYHPAKYEEEVVDEIVQRLLNRLIFIRMCEDKEIEEGKLWQALTDYKGGGKSIVNMLQKDIFPYYRKNYDSKLFGVTEEDIHETDKVDLSNEALAHVINRTYYTPDGNIRYDFSIIDADVLGSVYEQYLGYLLKKTPKRARLEEKRARRKELGIYYTPAYIVDYIVRNTLGELIKNKKPSDVDKIKLLDPACGSGSFLIKAFDVFDEYYRKHDKHYNQTKLDPGSEKSTITRKTKILVNNLYGVDLDSKAVEITQLNLLLKAAEQRHCLPVLQNNIKVGNSLIDDPTVARDRAFKWEEQFKQIMDDGGFDVVIGNPPYIDYREIEGMNFIKKNYYSAQVKDKFNILVLFIEQGLKLLKYGGLLGFIVSNQFLCSDFGLKLREYILKNCRIKQIIDVSMVRVFREASTYPIIIILEKSKPKQNKIKIGIVDNENKIIQHNIKFNEISQEIYDKFEKNLFLLELNKDAHGIIEKMKSNSVPLANFAEDITWGTSATGYGKKKIKESEWKLLSKMKQEEFVKLIQTADIQRYRIDWKTDLISQSVYTKNKLNLFEKNKIVIGRLNKFLKAAIDTNKYALGKATLLICKKDVNPKSLLAVLNSKLIDFYFKLLFKSTHMSQGYIRYDVPYLEKLPIKKLSEKEEKTLIKLVDKILSLNNRLNEIGNKKIDERVRIEEEIKKTDAEIDDLVYKIYGITEAEKKIIEESLK